MPKICKFKEVFFLITSEINVTAGINPNINPLKISVTTEPLHKSIKKDKINEQHDCTTVQFRHLLLDYIKHSKLVSLLISGKQTVIQVPATGCKPNNHLVRKRTLHHSLNEHWPVWLNG